MVQWNVTTHNGCKTLIYRMTKKKKHLLRDHTTKCHLFWKLTSFTLMPFIMHSLKTHHKYFVMHNGTYRVSDMISRATWPSATFSNNPLSSVTFFKSVLSFPPMSSKGKVKWSPSHLPIVKPTGNAENSSPCTMHITLNCKISTFSHRWIL